MVYPRAGPIGRGKELLDHQLRHLDVANVPKWIHVAALVRDRNLSRRLAPYSTSLLCAHKDASPCLGTCRCRYWT